MKQTRSTHSYHIPFIAMILILLVFGCGKSPAPDKAVRADFPGNRYLTATGTGKTDIDARRQALAQMSGIFESRVTAQVTSISETRTGTGQDQIFQERMAQRIQVASGMHLQGVRIEEITKDQETGRYTALAVLDKIDAGRNWASQVDRLDDEILAESRTLSTDTGNLRRMAALNRMIGKMADRRILEAWLRVVDYPVADLDAPGAGMWVEELAQLKSALAVHIMVHGPEGNRVRDILAKGLTQKGIAVVPTQGDANASVEGHTRLDTLNLDNPNVKFVRAAGSLQVFETRTGTLFAQVSEKVRKGHQDLDEASFKALEAVALAMSDSLLEALGFDRVQDDQ